MKEGQRRIGSLEVGRGVAAALVVLHHAGSIAEQPRFFDAVPFAGHLHFFYVGVDFFFVLSGFIISWVHWGDLGKPQTLGRYAAKRFLRIYPPYWGVLIPLVLLYLVFPDGGMASQRDPANIAMSFLLLPYPPQPVLGVAWTLVHEIVFYAVFALIIALGRKGLWLLPLWGVLILAGAAAGPLPFPLSFFLSPFNLEFLFGVGAAVILRSRTIPYPGLLAGSGVLLFLLFMLVPSLVPQDAVTLRFAFGIPAAMFVLGMVEIEWTRPLRLPPVLVFFGASSYAVYLVHSVAISMTIRLVAKAAGGHIGVEPAVLIVALIGLAAGMLYYALLEKRLTSLTRSVLQSLGLMEPSAARPLQTRL